LTTLLKDNIIKKEVKIMDKETRKRYQEFHASLTEVLTNVDNDELYYQNLIWALEIITNDLIRFNKEE